MKAHYVDIGIVSIIRQRLKDIEIQRWLSEIINNGVTRSPKPREIISLVFTFSYITKSLQLCNGISVAWLFAPVCSCCEAINEVVEG